MKRLLALAGALLPLPALAQQGFQLSPAVGLSQVYDDNFVPAGGGPESALLTQVSPRLGASYGAERVALLAHGALDVEAADDAPTRHAPWMRWSGDLQATGQLTERLTLTAGGVFWDTDTPRDANLITGFDPGIARLLSGSGTAGLGWRFTELTRGTLDAGFTTTAQAGLVTDEEWLRLGAHTRLTPRAGGRADLVVRRIAFGDGAATSLIAPQAGWDFLLSQELSLAFLGGPRFDRGALEGVEGSAAFRWEGERVHLTIAFASTQAAVPGLAGLLDTTSATALLEVRPDPSLRLSVAPAVYASSGPALIARVFEVRLDAVRELNRWLALVASYRFSAQQATFGQAGVEPIASQHHQIVFGVSFSAPGPATDGSAAGAWSTPGSPVPR